MKKIREKVYNFKKKKMNTQIKEGYNLTTGTVRDIFNAGADWYKKAITHSR